MNVTLIRGILAFSIAIGNCEKQLSVWNLEEMPAHIALVACLKQAQKNKGKKPLKPCLLRRRRIALIYINFLLRRKAHSSFFHLFFPILLNETPAPRMARKDK